MASDVLAETEDLRTGLAILQHRVDALEKRLAAEVDTRMSMSGLAKLIPDVQRMTQELFPGPFSWDVEADPEYPDDSYIVFNVEATGDMREMVRRQCQWHERIRAIDVDLSGKLRLMIVPR